MAPSRQQRSTSASSAADPTPAIHTWLARGCTAMRRRAIKGR